MVVVVAAAAVVVVVVVCPCRVSHLSAWCLSGALGVSLSPLVYLYLYL